MNRFLEFGVILAELTVMNKFLAVLFCFLGVSLSAQQTEYIDFKTADVEIEVLPDSSMVKGIVNYSFQVLKPIDSVFIDAQHIEFDSVQLDGKDVPFTNDTKKLWIKSNFLKGQEGEITFKYLAQPKKALYFLKRREDWNIWTQGQGKYTSNWLPSFDDVNEKIIFNLSVQFESPYVVLANGSLFNLEPIEGSDDFIWRYRMEHPMSSYLVAMAIGKYSSKTKASKSGIALEQYYFTDDSLKVEPTYRYSKQMFDFLEEEIGVAYPWQNYKQAPVYDFLYAGMENTSLTIFSDAFMVDTIGFNDKNYVNVNAHELAHQWFGDMVTATSGAHHWLQEGFATYYALLAERDIFGDDYFHYSLFQTAQELGRQDVAGQGTSLLNPKSSSLTFYQRGAWVLFALREKVGDKVFKNAVISYLERHKFSSVNTNDFISEVERQLGRSLSAFTQKWIKAKSFPFEDAVRLVYSKSAYVQEYVEVNCEANSSKCADYLKYYTSDDTKAKVIAQRPELISNDTFKNSWKVRQAISTYLRYVPQNLKATYESLLEDDSYVTIENALYNLWTSFPTDRAKYLSKTRSIEGFSDKNIEVLWLVLHLNTPEYGGDSKGDIFARLVDYTSEYNNAQLRMNAFKYLKLMNACNDQCRSNLEQAKTHHNWRLVKFAKNMITELDNPKKQ